MASEGARKEISFTLVTAAQRPEPPTRWVLFLHGILGSGANWRSFARRLVESRPGWGAALIDLRAHGASVGLAPPHTVAAAAADLEAILPRLAGPVEAVVGHSFGGKVALAFLERQGATPGPVWVLDATPGPRPGGRGSESTMAVLSLLEGLPRRFASREAFIGEIVSAGQPAPLAQWLAMNLEREGDEVVFSLDLAAIRAMLEDYFALDLWHVVERPPRGAALHVVIGGRSDVIDAADRARLERAAGESGGRLAVHVLERAGHWVQVDDPDGLLALVQASM
jgi:esterase